jgi:hypothetical protein
MPEEEPERHRLKKQQKGGFSMRFRPLLSVFSKIRFRYRITTSVAAVRRLLELSSSFPPSSAITVVVRASFLPWLSFVSDSLDGHRLLSPLGRFLFRYKLRIGTFPMSCRAVGRQAIETRCMARNDCMQSQGIEAIM